MKMRNFLNNEQEEIQKYKIANLTKAETGAELLEALDNYDSTVLENYSEPVDSEDDGYVSLTDADGTVTYVWFLIR